eukprot:6795402-Prymnesium_polylepis.1
MPCHTFTSVCSPTPETPQTRVSFTHARGVIQSIDLLNRSSDSHPGRLGGPGARPRPSQLAD